MDTFSLMTFYDFNLRPMAIFFIFLVQIKEPDIITSKETLTKRACGEKERFFINHQPKEVTRDSGRTFNKKMSPPPTNFQTSTTSTSSSSSSNQGSMPHYQYGSHQQVYPQMYPHQMEHHINQNTSQQQQIRGGMGRRNGRSRGGNNRRDFQVRQHNHQQNQQANDYGQPLLDQNQQGAVMNSAQYQPIYIHYSPWQNTLPPQNLNLTQNLTGQPLFAIQQPLMYQYGSPYPFMYNMMPQAHSMPHHQSELVENDIQDPPPIPWAHSQPIYHHSPLLNNDFQNSSDGFEMVNSINEYHEEIDPEITFVDVDSEDTFEDKEENLVGKTRDLLIQTISPVENSVELSLLKTSDTSTENEKTQNVCETSLEFIEPESVPISSAQKKQTASVSVSAIPNKDANNSETKKIVNEILEPSISFSSITASKYPTAPLEHKKTENNQTEVQQTALIERAKQQIVTTIIGHKETDKNVEDSKMSSKEENTEQELFIYDKKAQTKPTTSNLPSPAASARATWAGLFDSKKSVSSPSSSSNNFVSTEPQKSFPLSNSEELSTQAPPVSSNGSQVPSTAMSYSAVSAQHITTTEAKQHSSVKSLPQNKKNLTIVDENSNNQNNVNVAPLDQRSLKLGGNDF